jgi:hypothetical protein
MGFQEPWQLLQAWENKDCRQQDFWGLISCMGLRECSSVVLLLASEYKTCREWKFQGPIFHMGFREFSSVVLLLGELSLLACSFCSLWSSRNYGTCLHRCWFPWHFRVKVADPVLEGRV